MASTVTLSVGPTEAGPVGITPLVDGRELAELVADFEAERGWTPVGGYGGLVPAHFRFGDLGLYFLGLDNNQWPRPGQVWLLGCQCGEVGCWPLEARLHADASSVVWMEFAQPFRRERDYMGFGPFTFDRTQYENEVRSAVERLLLGSDRGSPLALAPGVRHAVCPSPAIVSGVDSLAGAGQPSTPRPQPATSADQRQPSTS